MRDYFVYIMTNRSGLLYTGMTNNLPFRVYQHQNGESDFTGRYHMTRLIYYEMTGDVLAAIEREKLIKRWSRKKKLALVRETNPRLLDLSAEIR